MNIVIAAGGTGGHVYPAVALAKEFQRRDPKAMITFVGTGRHLEETILAHEGCEVVHLEVQGVVGRGPWGALVGLARLPIAIAGALRILRKKQAHLVVGTGGYFSPPVVLAAWILRIWRVIVEPNAMPGLANRVLGPFAHRVFLAFEEAKPFFPRGKSRVVGTPIRREFLEDADPGTSGSDRTLLIFGGSQGARAINQAVVDAVKVSGLMREGLRLVHQTGPADYEEVRRAYADLGVSAEVVPFLFDMPKALRAADLVIARSGAGTLAELAVCGKPAILIPFPHATHHHQERNARAAEAAGAAVVIRQSELTGVGLAREVERLFGDPGALKTMAARSLERRVTDAAERIVDECRRLVAGRAASG